MGYSKFQPQIISSLGAFLAAALACGCVGPTTPFGALHSLGTPKKRSLPTGELDEPEVSKAQDSQGFYSPRPTKASIDFNPPRQVLHRKQNFKISIFDPRGFSEESKWRMYFNGFDVTDQILPSVVSFKEEDGQTLNLEFLNLRLHSDRENRIEVAFFHSDRSPAVVHQWRAPECSLYDINSVSTTEGFRPPAPMLAKIDKWSKEHQVNPSLVTGLVAQESGFNPQAVSWAKAIGLTQVTPIGDMEISRVEPDWPRDEQITRLPASVVKAMIHVGKITDQHDWRLNPELSIRGGLTLLQYMEGYWKKGINFSRLEAKFPHPQKIFTPVVLASYHSGAARVKRAINQHGPQFLDAEYLKEAKKYVNRVNSYCYHFAQRGGANETTP